MKRLLIAMGIVVSCRAQVSSGSLVGDVREATAASVSGAVITVRDNATGFSRTATTGENGAYRLDELVPGAYTVTTQHSGFRTVVVSPVVIEVDQKARLDFEMTAGSERDSVTVTGRSAPVQTDEASEGYLLQSGFIQSLPLANRNIIS